jgi:hypothetical protein
LTAVNPMLGFTGASFFASAFRPFAIAPIHYAYSAERFYATRRSQRAVLGRLLDTPRNLLLLRTIDRKGALPTAMTSSLIEIAETDYSSPQAASASTLEPALVVRPTLGRFRTLLSQGWSPETAYPGTVSLEHWAPGDPRRQCGVSSVWLAEKLLRDYGIPATFCRGSLVFGSETARNVDDHCWLELDGGSGQPLILDLTCDQAEGFYKQIVFESKAHLEAEQVHYIPQQRVAISDLPDYRIWARYQILLNNLKVVSSPRAGCFSAPETET